MNKLILFLFYFFIYVQSHKIKHIVVLMLENRAFDHMLGYLKLTNPYIDGLYGNETCPYDPQNLSMGYAKVSWDAPDITYIDPDHSLPGTTQQIFGFNLDETKPAPMNGFVKSYADGSQNGSQIMEMLNNQTAITINTLANEFMVFDKWYSDLPGPTEPNRMFFNSATSYGSTEAVDELLAKGYPQKTIFESLSESGYTWHDYFTDFPTILFFKDLRSIKYIENFRPIDMFIDDVQNNNLPTYSFIEPRWFATTDYLASDQHPPHPISWGENLIADIYEALRNGSSWNETLFIITYDEHGGFYDHVPTPLHVPKPDNHKAPSNQPQFNFTRLGIRVPTVFVSPWLNKHSVTHEPLQDHNTNEKTYYTHSSFPGTLKDMFGLNNYLTKRDRWAGKWNHIFDDRSEPRTDCPKYLPRPPINVSIQQYNNPISELQRNIINIALGLTDKSDLEHFILLLEANSIKTELEGSLFVKKQINQFLNQ